MNAPKVEGSGPIRTVDEVVYVEIVRAMRLYITQRTAARALGISEKTLYNKLQEYAKRGWPTA